MDWLCFIDTGGFFRSFFPYPGCSNKLLKAENDSAGAMLGDYENFPQRKF